jgi:ribose transport system permease protein
MKVSMRKGTCMKISMGKGIWERPAQRFGVLAALALMFLAFSLDLPGVFPTSGNLLILVTSQSAVMLLALAVSIPLRAGEFDLSVAAQMVLSAVVCALLAKDFGWPLPLVILAGIAVGVATAIVNSVLIIGLKINGFIATLGIMSVLTGLAYGFSGSSVILLPENSPIIRFCSATWLGIPTGVWYGWFIAVVVWIAFERRPIGRYWLFAGGSPEAARLAGVRTSRVKTLSLVFAGVISGFAGVVLLGSLGSADPTTAGSYLLAPYAAAFVGTAVLQEGRVNIVGTVTGVYLVSVVDDGLQLIGAQPWFSQLFSGLILVIALGVSKVGSRARTGGASTRMIRLYNDKDSTSPPSTEKELDEVGDTSS